MPTDPVIKLVLHLSLTPESISQLVGTHKGKLYNCIAGMFTHLLPNLPNLYDQAGKTSCEIQCFVHFRNTLLGRKEYGSYFF